MIHSTLDLAKLVRITLIDTCPHLILRAKGFSFALGHSLSNYLQHTVPNFSRFFRQTLGSKPFFPICPLGLFDPLEATQTPSSNILSRLPRLKTLQHPKACLPSIYLHSKDFTAEVSYDPLHWTSVLFEIQHNSLCLSVYLLSPLINPLPPKQPRPSLPQSTLSSSEPTFFSITSMPKPGSSHNHRTWQPDQPSQIVALFHSRLTFHPILWK